MMAKNAPYPPRHRDYFPAKEPGHVVGWHSRVALTYFIAGPLAVSPSRQHDCILTLKSAGR
jgi:hypothetical protein